MDGNTLLSIAGRISNTTNSNIKCYTVVKVAN